MKGVERSRQGLLAAALCLAATLPAAAQDVDVTIGDLPPGKSVKILFEATVDLPVNGPLVATVQNQGAVTGTNFGSLPTDDPDDPTSNADPTVTPLDTLSVGNQVWRDLNGNNVFDGSPTDGLLDGVTMNLYLDDGDGVLDAGDGAAIATATTAGGGLYAFAGLQPGEYIVEVAECNFTGIGCPAVLAGLGSIAPFPAVDPDDDVDNDDNGEPVAGFGTAAEAVTLAFNAEPPATLPDGDADTDTNLTVDFGFGQIADVEIVSKTDSPDPVVAGSNITYTIEFRNNGSGAAVITTVTDPTPTGTTFVSATPAAGWMASAPAVGGTGNVVFSKASVANGETATFSITVQVDPAAASGSTITNTATAASNSADPDGSNNSKMATTNVITSADVELTSKTDTPDPVTAGENITYTINYTNNGPSNAASVEVADPVPTGTTFVSSTKPGSWGSIEPAVGGTGTVRFLRTSSPAGEMVAFTITVKVAASAADGSTIDNTATVSSSTSDAVPGNESAMASTTVAAEADMTLTKADDLDPAAPGDTVVYTLTASNAGPSDALNVQVTDTLPAEMNFVSTSGCDNDPNGFPTCDLGTIAAGGMDSYTLTVTVDAKVAAGVTSVTNDATVSTDTTETSGANNDASEATGIAAAPDLVISKSDGDTTSFPGGVIDYEIIFDNIGDQDATGVVVTETVPAGTTFNEAASGGAGVWSCADGDVATTVCTHSFGALDATPPGPRFVAGPSSSGGPRPITVGGATRSRAQRSETAPRGARSAGSGPRSSGPAQSDPVTDRGGSAGGGPAPLVAGPGNVTFAVTVLPGIELGTERQITNTASIADDGANGADPVPANNESTDTTPLPVDFGDAPDPLDATAGLYPTLVVNNGPRHAIRPAGDPLLVFLGSAVDDDSDGQPSAPLTPAADGDDTDFDGDDEDGVSITGGLIVGGTTDLEVTASAAGLLNAWVDFDVDGVFAPGEQIFADEPLAAGVNALSFATPPGALTGPTADLLEGTFARFRFDTTGGLGPTGQADHGEVEDYFVPLLKDADLETTISPRTPYGLGGSLLLYDLAVENLGPANAEDVAVDLNLPANTIFLGVEPAATPCILTGSMLTCDLGDVDAATTSPLVVGLWIDPRFELDLLLDATVSSISPDPVAANDTAADTTPATRGRSLLATEVTDPITRKVFVGEAKAAEETAGLVMKDGTTGDTIWIGVFGESMRTVDLAAVPDIGDTPSPEIAILGYGFDGSTDVVVVDGTSRGVISSFEVPGARVPVGLATLPDVGGPPSPDLAILTRAADGSSVNILVVDAGDGTVVDDHVLSMPIPPTLAPFPIAIEAIGDFAGSPAPELAALVRDPETGDARVLVLDPGSGLVVLDKLLPPGHFPVDLASPGDLGDSPAPDVLVLARRESDGKTVVSAIDPLSTSLFNTVEFDPMLTPFDLEVVPDFGGSPAPELAVLGAIGPKIVNEVRDASIGAPLGGTIVDGMPSPIPLVPLALAVHPDIAGGPEPDIGFLGEFLGSDEDLYVTDGNGVPIYIIPLVP